MAKSQPELLKTTPQADIDFEKSFGRPRSLCAPVDYKHYHLSMIFLCFLSLKYKRRKEELEKLIREPPPRSTSPFTMNPSWQIWSKTS